MRVHAAVVVAVGVLIGLVGAGPAASQTTYYVRLDGGSTADCTGLADAAYQGEGSAQACAWDHPFRALPPGGAARIAGGDTLIIAAGSYRMGIGAPEDELCAAEYPWDCHMPPLPSGPDPNSPTRVLGAGWDQGCAAPPTLWGAERASPVVDLTGASNVEIACLEITDHLGCVEFHPKPSLRCERDSSPYGNWAAVGIYAADSANVTLRNLNVHGLGNTGIHAGRLHDWTVENVRVAGNGWAGWNGDIDGDDSNSGTMRFRRWTVEWNGCSETWPGGNPSGCWAQSAGGYGDGVGTGETLGTWVIEDSLFLNNTSDGLDLLYLLPGASVEIRRTRAQGNAGNQVKTSGPTLIENSIIVGNCASFEGKPFTYDVDNCRALGNALSLQLRQGDPVTVVNSTVTGQGDCLVLADCDSGVDGSESVVLLNNIFQGQDEFLSPDDQTCLAFAEECPADPFDFDYSVIAGVKGAVCPGANDICGVSAGLADAQIHKFDAHLTPASPALDTGLPVGGLVPPEDFDGIARPLRNGVDRGAYESMVIPTREEQACRKEIRKRVTNFVKTSLQTMQRCVGQVNDGVLAPPCPDGEASAAIAKAAEKLDPERLEKKCPAEVLGSMTVGGACVTAATSAELSACLLSEGTAAVDALITVEYSVTEGALATSEQLICQGTIAKVLGTPYALKRIKLSNRCLNKRDTGSLPYCLDAVSQRRLERARGRAETRIQAKCSDDLIQQLQAAGGFGDGCGTATNVADLLACELVEHDARADQIVGIVP